MLSRVLRFLRITDKDGNLSLTNLIVYVVLIKVILKADAIQATDLGTILAAILGYQGKRAIESKKEVDVIKAKNVSKIALADVFHRGDKADAPQEVIENAKELVAKVNHLLSKLDLEEPVKVNSGYRDPSHNKRIGGSSKSAHMFGMALDLRDPKNDIKSKITVELLEECGLYMENPADTPTWCHLQTRPTRRRIFLP